MTLSPPNRVILLVSIGIGLGLIGIVTYVTFPAVLHSTIVKKLFLVEGTIGYKYWKDISLPIYLNFYFFNLTNPEEVYALKSKPILEELGPYVFREERTKVEIGWNENGTLSYRQRKQWYFRSDLSNGSLDDKIVQINAVMMAAAAKAKELDNMAAYFAISAILAETESTWFIRKKIRELIFEGYTDRLLNFSRNFVHLPFDKFGWFYGRNGTDDGAFTIFTGKSDIKKLDEIESFNGLPNVTAYDAPCNIINGTAGDLWPPFRAPGGQIEMFVPDICRTLHLKFLEERTILGLNAFRYWADQTELDNGKTNPDNKCFCGKDECFPPGALDVSRCKFNAPAAVSYPHFLFADSYYTQKVIGMKPDPEKHSMYIDLNSKMGIPMSVAARMQINIIFEQNTKLMQFENVTGRTFFPVFWFSNTAILDEKVANELKVVVKTLPLVVSVISFFLVSVAILLVIIALTYATLYVKGQTKTDVAIDDSERKVLTSPQHPKDDT